MQAGQEEKGVKMEYHNELYVIDLKYIFPKETQNVIKLVAM